jgi:hypothetical protein
LRRHLSWRKTPAVLPAGKAVGLAILAVVRAAAVLAVADREILAVPAGVARVAADPVGREDRAGLAEILIPLNSCRCACKTFSNN